MKRLRLFMIAPALALAAGCAALGAIPSIISAVQAVASVAGRPANPSVHTAAVVPSNGTVGDQIVMRGTQGLIVANNAYQTAAAIAEAYVRSGRSTPEQRARIRQLSDRAISLLEHGEGGLSVAQRGAEVLNIVAELNIFGGRS